MPLPSRPRLSTVKRLTNYFVRKAEPFCKAGSNANVQSENAMARPQHGVVEGLSRLSQELEVALGGGGSTTKVLKIMEGHRKRKCEMQRKQVVKPHAMNAVSCGQQEIGTQMVRFLRWFLDGLNEDTRLWGQAQVVAASTKPLKAAERHMAWPWTKLQ